MSIFLAFVLLFYIKIQFTVAEDICNAHKDCDGEQVCCKATAYPPRKSEDGKKLCRPRLDTDSRSCYGHYCTADVDCEGRRYDLDLCCKSNLCSTCVKDYCKSNTDCVSFGKCCREGKCVTCTSYPGCNAHSECESGLYCCGATDENPNAGHCKGNCIGDTCDSDKDCVSYQSEYCSANKCIKDIWFNRCSVNAECNAGSYCCRPYNAMNQIGDCNKTCVGHECTFDDDCGPTDECCTLNKCVKCGAVCKSNSDCLNGAYCCKGTSLEKSKCSFSCRYHACTTGSDCGGPDMFCTGVNNAGVGACTLEKTCTINSDCITSDGKQYVCCNDNKPGSRSCFTNCVGYKCSSNADCGLNECCSTDNTCTKSQCQKSIPASLLGVVIGISFAFIVIIAAVFWCWTRKQKRTVSRQPRGHPNEIQVSRNPQTHVSLAEQQQMCFLFPSVINNQYTELHHPNGTNEPNISPPSYDDVIHTPNNQNMPPPPYSLTNQNDTPELNREQPPNYEVNVS